LEPFQAIMRSKTWDASMYDPKVYDTHLLNLQEFVRSCITSNHFLDPFKPVYVHGDSSETAIGLLLLQPVKCENSMIGANMDFI
jgi:hypothetical protein